MRTDDLDDVRNAVRKALEPKRSPLEYSILYASLLCCATANIVSQAYAFSFLYSWYLVDIGGISYEPPLGIWFGLPFFVTLFLINTNVFVQKSAVKFTEPLERAAAILFAIWINVGVAYVVYLIVK